MESGRELLGRPLRRVVSVVTGSVRSRGGWLLLLGLVIPTALSSLTVFVTASLLGPDGRGQIAFVLATASLVIAAGSFGFYLCAARSPEPVARQYLDASFLTVGLIGVVLVLVGVVFAPGLLTPQRAAVAGLGALAGVGTLFAQRVAQAHVSDREYFLIGALPALVTASVILAVVLLGGRVQAYLIAWLFLAMVTLVYAQWRMRRSVRIRVAHPYDLPRYFREAAPVGFSGIASTLVLRSDIVILGLISVGAQVGYYSLATAISGVPFLLAEVFALRAVSRHKGADPADYVRQVPMIARNAALVTGLSIVPIFLLGYLVIRFLLPDFMPSVLPMAILCVAVIPSSHLRVVLAAASMQGFQRVLYGYSVAGVVLSVCYLPAATKGALGVAMASLVIYLVLQVAVLRWWRGQARKITPGSAVPDVVEGSDVEGR